MTETTRKEHLDWCKERALATLGEGSPQEIAAAWASMVSDLRAHPETETHDGIMLGTLHVMGGHLKTAEEMEHFINGFG